MVNKCCIKSCKTEWCPTRNVTFHRVPLKNPKLLESWIQAIPEEIKITKYATVCSQHFTSDSFEEHTMFKTRLKRNAVPSVFGESVISQGPRMHCTYSLADEHNYGSICKVAVFNKAVNSSFCLNETSTLEVLEPEEVTCDACGQILSHTVNTIEERPKVRMKDVAVETLRRLSGPSEEELKLRRKVCCLQRKVSRQRERITTLAEMLRTLKKSYTRKANMEKVLNKLMKKI
ncbi:THAP domain-containing protein 1 [Orussus abietinus]|uniref:THAP domain-containing protein 1 n=1 Tax=Orussus abietinus TaxID=222816 RepID=UPI000626DE20|nr:THAP domain-containing protein 1 [Orussus abietinus]